MLQHAGNQALAETIKPLTILSVSRFEEDHSSLECILSHTNWKLLKAQEVPAEWPEHNISVVMCASDADPEAWIEMLSELQGNPMAPAVIVTSRTADERLWADAINRGAWDVLAKPFDRTEVFRSVKSAWQHWYNQGRNSKVMKAAS